MTRVLVVEDELHLAKGLLFNLQAEGYAVELAHDGEDALKLLLHQDFDALVLDVMLPGRDGFSVAAALREQQNFVPILMLTARGRHEDVLRGFESGADDYLTKPFDLSILIARLNSLLRRMQWQRSSATDSAEAPGEIATFHFAGRTLDFASLELHALGRTVRLTLMEAELLRYLVRNPGRIVSRKEILDQVWHVREDTDTRAIDNFIVRLRRYVEEEPSRPAFLQTVRGVGYRFQPQPE